MGETDISLRALAAGLVDELAKGLVIGKNAKIYRFSSSLPASSRDSDQVCFVCEDEVCYFLLIEIQLRLENDTGFRVFEYASRLHAGGSHALADDVRGAIAKGTPIPVRAFVLVLTGSKEHKSGVRKHFWTHPPCENGYFPYEVRLIYKMTLDELMALPCFHWVFLPLAADATQETLAPHLRTVQNLIRMESDPMRKRRVANIAAGMSAVAQHADDPTLRGFVCRTCCQDQLLAFSGLVAYALQPVTVLQPPHKKNLSQARSLPR